MWHIFDKLQNYDLSEISQILGQFQDCSEEQQQSNPKDLGINARGQKM